jgi:hypothetical protein
MLILKNYQSYLKNFSDSRKRRHDASLSRMEADERPKQVLAGTAVIGGVSALLLLLAVGRFLPGLGGEFFARILGIITTPFLMEITLFVLGIVLVMTLNHWRQRRDGDELVYLEELQSASDEPADDGRRALRAEATAAPQSAPAANPPGDAAAPGTHGPTIEGEKQVQARG